MDNTILLVDDDPGAIQLMGRILSGVGQLRFATSGADALRLAAAAVPDLILLDAEMPGMSGFEVCVALKAEPRLATVPVIFISSHSDAAYEVAGFKAGATDFIEKPVSAPLLLARVMTQLRLKRMADELRHMSTTDFLTGVANRRAFEGLLTGEWLRARRHGDPVSLLLIDVDHFKLFNDRYGHPSGDACLRNVAQALIGISRRPADLVARYGGEEFVLLLPMTPRRGAEHMAEFALDAVAALDIAHAASPTASHVTVSVGIACFDDASAGWTGASADLRSPAASHTRYAPGDLVQAADTALYAAKDAGRAQAKLCDIAEVDSLLVSSADRGVVPRPGAG